MSSTLLLIGLSASLRTRIGAIAATHGVEVTSGNPEAVAASRRTIGLCLLGPQEDEETLQTVRGVTKLLDGAPIVVINESLRTSTIVQLIRMGVAEVIDANIAPEDIFAEALPHLSREPQRGVFEIIGESETARALKRQIVAVARTSSTVLLTGETGTGKGLVAREIHRLSRHAAGPFVHTDSTAFSPTVIESELFGHERGAFTSASERRRGRFELAENGTIFLDEIGDLDLALQVKLLRVLQDRVFERVGGGKSFRMNARVIAATNAELELAVQQGRFRADLYYRLNVFHIRVPALRERIEDIPMLVGAHLGHLSSRLGVPTPRMRASFLKALESHRWPGNVRELVNVLERCLIERRVDALEAQDLEGILEVRPLTPQPVARTSLVSPHISRSGSARLIGPSESMRKVRQRIDQIATARSNVLITGETGTGKELAARALHEASGRHPLIVVAVPELSEELLELELFGCEAGVTSASGPARSGLFESAHGGTLFLDEIGDAPVGLQARILRVLEAGEVRRLGAETSRPVDTRVIAATHRDLLQATRIGSFREDLYYRIRESTIDLAPLRERTEDIEPIARALVHELSRMAHRPVPELAPDLFEALRSQTYPGNVRELRTQLQNLLMAWDGRSPIQAFELVEFLATFTPGLSAEDLADRQRMVEAYRSCNGNQEAARRQLGFSRGEWRHRWSRFGLDVLRKRR